MSIAHWASRHKRSVLFLLSMVSLAGLYSAWQLPVALFPAISFPRVAVTLDAGDQPVTQMLNEITRPVEQALKSVPGLRGLRSTTSRGSAELSLHFDWGQDMDVATLQVESVIANLLPTLPPGITPEVRRMNPTALFPIVAYALTSDTLDPVALRNIAHNQLLPLLSAVNGVASVNIMGGQRREFHVDVAPERLRAYGMTLDDVNKALTAANVLSVTGRMEDRHRLLLVFADSRIRGIDDIKHVIVRNSGKAMVELQDIADIHADVEPQTSIVEADGKPAVIVQIFQQADGNTVQVVRDVKAALRAYRPKMPRHLVLSNWYDQSELVTESAAGVRDAILIGIALAALVLLVFLRNWRITLTAVIVVPAVLASTVLLLHVFHMSFNIMTLGGMAASIGLIVDDAIVMIEQIVRRVHGRPRFRDRHQIIRDAAGEFVHPLAGSSVSTVIVFLPLAFLGGVTGAFFKALSLTMAFALVVSFLVSWFVVPLLAGFLLHHRQTQKPADSFLERILTAYRRLLSSAVRRPMWVLLPALSLIAAGIIAYLNVGSGFMPAMDEGGFVLDYVAPPGTALNDTDYLLRQVGEILKETPEVATYSRRTGLQLGGGLTEANTGDFFVRLKPPPRRNIEDVMADVRAKIAARVPGLDIELLQLMEDVIGDLTAVPQPVEIKIFGEDPKVLEKTAHKLAAELANIKGLVDIFDGVVLAGDGLDVRIDPAKAALEGMNPAMIADQLSQYLSGTVATGIQTNTRTIGVRVWIPLQDRLNVDQIRQLTLVALDGHRLPLSRIATVGLILGQAQIQRDNLKTMIAVTARIEGRDLGSAMQDVKKLLARPKMLPAGVYTTLGGLYAEQQQAFRGLLAVLVAAIGLVFLSLLFLYERFSIALTIIAMPLMALNAVLFALWLTGIELNISALMGMTMIVGIVTEVAIFYFSEYRQLAGAAVKPSSKELIDAGVSRLRPIMMTSLAAILALLPLALGIGGGSTMQKPLAIAIVAGLLAQMPLVLLVMPVLYQHLSSISAKS